MSTLHAFVSLETKRIKIGVSWPISSPFPILHVHLWMLGHFTDINDYMTLMNIMYDMNHFVLVVSIPEETSTILSSHFMQKYFNKIWTLLSFFLR